MSVPYADLHTHTTYSDGRLDPAELLAAADAGGLRVMAITDHDTLDGWDAAQEPAAASNVDLVPGVELSVTVGDREVHLLGYGFDPLHAGLRAHLEEFADARRVRAQQMVDKLRARGVDITLAAVHAAADGASAIGRPHLARALVAAGQVDSYDAAFEQYLGQGGPAFVEKTPFPARAALDLLHAAGGIGVLAHPGHWTSGRLLHQLRRAGLDGIEVRHPSHDASLVAYYQRLVHGGGLVATGGSDYHGRPPEEADQASPFGTYGLSRSEWQAIQDLVQPTGTAG